MEFPQTEVVVKDKKYLITAFGGVTSLNYYKRLMRLVSPAMMAMQGEGDVLEGKSAMQMAVECLMDATDKVEVEQLVIDLLKNTTYNGKSIDPEKHFAGGLGGLLLLVLEIVKFNFSDVFTDLVTAVGSVVAGTMGTQTEQ